MNRRSIRFRLTLWYSLALAAGLFLLALAIWVSMQQMLLRDIHRSLTAQVTSSQSFVEMELREPSVHLVEELGEYSRALTPDSYLRIMDDTDTLVFNSNNSFGWPAPLALSRPFRVHWNGKPYLVLFSPQPVRGKRWLFAVAASLHEPKICWHDYASSFSC